MLQPGLRKALLTAHVVISVGWLGAVIAFLGLALAAMLSSDPELVRGAYLTMELSARLVLVPLAVASLVTGIAQSLTTRWGLFRHYWVVFKLIINIAATLLLLTYTRTTLADLGQRARDAASAAELGTRDALSPIVHGALALVLLLVATTLGVVKPRGRTRYGRRRGLRGT